MSNTSSNGGGGSSKEIVHQGWLTKSPPSKAIFKPRWRRRWFILRAGSYPNQYLLEYFTDETCRRLKGKINLDECEQLGLATNPQPTTPFALQERHKYIFSLRIPHRIYYLAADTEAEMSKWVSCLCQICGLKTTEDETDGCNKPPDENNRPLESEENHNNLDSDESSPTLSTVSGPYIPISECFTGKPIKFNDKQSEYYNSSVFAFPPKVNWSTYPRKISVHSRIVASSVPPVAPPRPPKTIVPGISVTASPTLEKDSLTPNESRTVFTYDNLDEQDSSSTSSSLQSPAGPLYTNLPDLNTPGLTPASLNSSSSISSAADANAITPPKVNRNLKPDLNKSFDGTSPKSPFETAGKSQRSLDSPASIENRRRNGSMDATFPSYRKDGSMTLPSRYNSRTTASNTGPAIDRSRKPPDSPITLGPTPAQLKNQNDHILRTTRHNNSNFASNGSTKNAIPSHSSGRRLMGPILSPTEKKPVFHEYEQPAELIGAYLQIDTKSLSSGGSDGKINTFKPAHRKPNGLHSDQDSSVEYKLIDPVKTKALNQMIQEREQQLGTRAPKNQNAS